MDSQSCIDRMLELGVIDGLESEVRLWLSHDDKKTLLGAVETHGRLALPNVTKGEVVLYSRELRQVTGHDAQFLSQLFLSSEKPSKAKALRYEGPSRVLLLCADHSFRKGPGPVICTYSPFADRAKYMRPTPSLQHEEMIYGWRLVATMQMRTPLRVLEQHGRIERCAHNELPKLIYEQWEGIWSVKSRPWRDLGIDIEEMPGTMASEIGYIDADGGDLLALLIMTKRIVKCEAEWAEKISLMNAAAAFIGAGGHSFGALMARWGGPEVVLNRNEADQ